MPKIFHFLAMGLSSKFLRVFISGISAALLLAMTVAPMPLEAGTTGGFSIIGKYDSRDPYGIGAQQNWSKMTHLVAGSACYVSSYWDPTLVYYLNSSERTKAQSAGLKYLLNFNGGSDLTAIMNYSTNRAKLVANLASVISSGGFDGLQVDWEDFSGGITEAVYHQFLVSLHSALPSGKIIMPCVPGDKGYGWLNTTDMPYIDYLLLMCYGGPGADQWGTSYSKFTSVITPWISAGYPAAKLIAGIPVYSDDTNDYFGSYYQVINKFHPATSANTIKTYTADGWSGSNISVNGGTLYFNGADLAVSKCNWVKSNGLGGVYLWCVNWDTTPGSANSILDTVYNNLNGGTAPVVGTLDHITVSPSNPSVVTRGTQTYSAQGYDASNNAISGLTYSWSVTNATAGSVSSSGVFTAGSTAGSYANVIRAAANGKTGTASVTVYSSGSTRAYSIIAQYDCRDPYGIGAQQNWSKMTHLVAGYGCYVKSSWDPTLVYTLNSSERTKAQSAGLKYLLNFNGGSNLTAIMNYSTNRAKLVANLASVISSGGFDGLQVDWEDFSGGITEAVYHQFLVSLHSALPSGKIIMPCVPGDKGYGWLNTTDMPYIDYLLLMCYGGPGADQWGTSYSKFTSVITPWISAGYPAAKLIAGIPVYSDDTSDNLGSYYQLINKFHPATSANTIKTYTADGWSGSNISVNGGTLYFNGADLAASKCSWVKSNGLGGVYLWCVNWDTTPGSANSLLDTVYNNLR